MEVTLPNGGTALVRARQLDGGGATKTARQGKFDFDGVTGAIEGVGEAVRAAVAKAAPDSVSVELGFEVAVKAGKLTGLLVDGDAKGSIKVTLAWNHAGSHGQ